MMNMAGTPAGPIPEQQRRMKPEDQASHITVSDPVQHADGLNKYTSYRVDVRPLTPTAGDVSIILAAPQTYTSVLRRYSDFLWLYERLHTERAGAIVPPLPEKQPVGRFSPTFVEERRVQLERFLRRVAVHPELGDSAALDTFLRADDVTFQTAKHAKGGAAAANNNNMLQQSHMLLPVQQSSPKKEGIKRWFAETKTSMTGDLVKSPDDDLFEEIQRYIHGLDTQMRNVSQQAAGLVRKGKEIANGLFEFGLAFNLLGQSEGDALGDALTQMGATADRLSVLSQEHAEQEMAQFEEPLQDYIKWIHAVKLALQRRHEKRLTYSTCLAEVEAKHNSLGKLRSQIGSEAKAYAMEMALRQAHEAAEQAREAFAVVSQRVLREVDRFKREKSEDMRRTVLSYIQLQVDYNKRMEQVWASLIPQLEQTTQQGNNNNNNSNNNNTVSPESSQALPQQQGMLPQGMPPHQMPQQQQQQQQQQAPPLQQPVIQQSHDIPQYMSSPMAPAPPAAATDSMINIQYRD